MKYIAYKNYVGKTMTGESVKIASGTKCDTLDVGKGTAVMYKTTPVAYITSEVGHQYFTRNDDGEGMRRGSYIIQIQAMLKPPANPANRPVYDKRWAAIWADEKLKIFRRPEQKQHWLWNHAFYNANIEDLQYIFEKIKAIRR